MKILPNLPLRLLLAVLLAASASLGYAGGTVTQLSGTLSVRKADGTTKVLGRDSKVEPGDVLTTEKDSYAQVRFTDGGSLTLKPNTQIRVESYTFEDKAPEKDNLVFSLIKGGLRALTGLVGKRAGRQDAYRLNTATATIGIRGTYYGVDDIAPGADSGLPPGVYLVVFDGIVVAFNEAGFQAFQAGQYGFMGSLTTPPQILPQNPGIPFTPPPGFTEGGPAACVVR
ncbi:MAG: FecR domain-containing protein [bacterium]